MIEVLISALVLASMYGLVAIGISFTWASIGMLNLAQGFIFTAGGYTAFLFAQVAIGAGLSGPLLSIGVIVFGMLGSAVAGLIVGGIAFLPLQDRQNFRTRSLIATLAISLIGTQVWLLIFGPQSKPLPPIFGDGRITFGDTGIGVGQLGTIIVASLMLTVVIMWMRASRAGLQRRKILQK